MKILGIRTAPKQLRFALLEVDGTAVSLLNQDSENLIKVPVGVTAAEDIVHWQKSEVDRILRQNQDIALVAIKTSEYARSDTKKTRLASYLDAAVLLAAKDAHKPVCTRLYSQIGAKRSNVKEHAEGRVGTTSKYWNEQMADAVMVAWAVRGGLMAAPKFNAGDQLYKYLLRQHIGGGHFGQVWLAHDLTLARDVAVKILDESMAPVAAHLNEAKVGNRLEHPNVIHIHYADVVGTPSGNVVAIAMDYHPNGCATSQLNPTNFVPMTEAIRITIDILRGLEYLHESGLFHNDIKPSNILIGPRGRGFSRIMVFRVLRRALNLQRHPTLTFFTRLQKQMRMAISRWLLTFIRLVSHSSGC